MAITRLDAFAYPQGHPPRETYLLTQTGIWPVESSRTLVKTQDWGKFVAVVKATLEARARTIRKPMGVVGEGEGVPNSSCEAGTPKELIG